MAKDKTDVSTTSSAYDRMSPRWRLINTLLGGTEAMREAGREYTPQHVEESNEAYERRLSRTTLLNFFEAVHDSLTSRPFRDPITLKEDVPQPLVELAEDIDLLGNHLNVFARSWFSEGLAQGLSHVLVDFPTSPREESGPRTLDDDRRERLRPYWVRVAPENLIAAYSEDGQLAHVRIKEVTVERDGFYEQTVERVRVLEPGTWQVYRRGQGKKWTLEDEGTTGLSYIPLVTFYTGKRQGEFEVKPPLTDLAHLNISHWQSSSDQRHVLTVARFPILAVSGVTDVDGVRIGPNNYLTTPDPQGKWYYVEHTGAAIEAGRKDLETLEDQMASHGAEFLKRRPGTQTATERALDSAESVSSLEAMALDFRDALEIALSVTADWLRLDEGGSVEMTTSFSEGEASAIKAEILLKLRAARDLSRSALLAEMQALGFLPEDFDAEIDAELLTEESSELTAGLMGDSFGANREEPTGAPDGDDPGLEDE